MGFKSLGLLALVLSQDLLLAITPNSPRPYGTKTAYDWSFTVEELTRRNSGTPTAPSVCSPVYVSGLLKHGTKYPSSGTIRYTGIFLDELAGKIQAPEYTFLNSQGILFNSNTANTLSPRGQMEMEGIGAGFANRYTALFQGASEQEVAFYASSDVRSQSSAEAFRDRMAQILGKFSSSPVTEDDIAQFADVCQRYIDEVREADATYAEQDAFNDGPEMTSLAETMTTRLNLNGSEITTRNLVSLYQLVAYEQAILGSSPWADVWTSRDELDVLEYQDDVELYWAESYGQPITREMSCVVMEKLFGEMEAAKTARDAGNSSYHKATFVFGDVEVVLSPASLINLFPEDPPLRASNYAQKQNRVFRSGIIAPQAANLGLILYECTEGAHGELAPDGVSWPQNLDKYMVELLYKELPTRYPASCDHTLCPYDVMRERLAPYIDTCNFQERCKPVSIATVTKANLFLVVLAVLLFLTHF